MSIKSYKLELIIQLFHSTTFYTVKAQPSKQVNFLLNFHCIAINIF